ncbi:MAG: DUF881 domain-containing protein [Acidimicrobiia bacterium]|nr:DUF881 domain-containing protein [Acidimicrobiia bacterium]
MERGGTAGRLLVAIVAAAMGFLLISQLNTADDLSEQLEAESETDLTVIFARLNDESAALQAELTDLQIQLQVLESSAEQDSLARAAAESELSQLEILAGTVGARGPGVKLRIDDPNGELESGDMLDLVQELRDAGAEAIAIDDQRVGAATSFGGEPSAVTVDGTRLPPSFEVLAIGDPATLEGGLAIRGGALELLQAEGSIAVAVTAQTELEVPPLR